MKTLLKMATSNAEVHKKTSNNDTEDLTAPYYELEAFNSIWQALKWQEVRTRVPICLKKTIRSRYFYANLVYLAYHRMVTLLICATIIQQQLQVLINR
jgi:hypothetical protein